MLYSVLFGIMTHHFIGSDLPYCNTLNASGTIQNPYAVVMAGNEDAKLGAIVGKDSACGDIVGPIGSVRIRRHISFVLGFYNTNFKEFRALGMEPPSVGGVTPVAGVDISVPIAGPVSFDTIISMGIITHAIRMDF